MRGIISHTSDNVSSNLNDLRRVSSQHYTVEKRMNVLENRKERRLEPSLIYYTKYREQSQRSSTRSGFTPNRGTRGSITNFSMILYFY